MFAATAGGKFAHAGRPVDPFLADAEEADHEAGGPRTASYEYQQGQPQEVRHAQYQAAPAAGAAWQPADAAYGGAAMAWPGISPYMVVDQDSVENSNGIWQYDSRSPYTDPPRRYHFSIDYARGAGSHPGNYFIGDTNAALHAYPTDDTFPFPPFTRLTNVDYGDARPFSNWPVRDTSGMHKFEHNGVRAGFGWTTPEDSGILLSGFFLWEKSQSRSFGLRNASGNPADVNTQVFRLPLADGTSTGQVIPFDGDLNLTYEQSVYGADLDAYAAPFFKRPSFMLRFAYGVKYFSLSELFKMVATDSGLDYTWEIDGSGGADGTIDNIAVVTDPFITTIVSTTDSRMVGPQFGLRYDFGGDYFKLWGATKVGFVVNMEDLKVVGVNVRTLPDQFFFGNGGTTVSTRRTTHLSPLFQQSLGCDMALLAAIPIINRVDLLRRANVRLGYDVVMFGEIARPANIITYNYDKPIVSARRSTFTFQTYSVGLDWRF